MVSTTFNNKEIYNQSLELASDHYENFPVASFIFPKRIRKDVALIYRFARTADDIVDEGDEDDKVKLNLLNSFRSDFEESLKGNYKNKFWELLHQTIIQKQLNPQHFLNLLTAFEQDLKQKSYETFEDLLGYCKNSANPVGRIMLELYGIKSEKIVNYSDKICTALQLTNFWQDVKIDIHKNRIYIPLDDFEKFNSNSECLKAEQTPPVLRQIIEYEVKRTDRLFIEGEKILEFLPYRLRLQVGWTINGGRKILKKISKSNYDVLNYRPTLSKVDYLSALVGTLFK
ncbi:MAG: squalene synthase HpnC [Melioribacteraceae bacterium]|nr:squalene synthase HpnC [Melioribacteraceae bacterium]